jgi:hypothetical protein
VPRLRLAPPPKNPRSIEARGKTVSMLCCQTEAEPCSGPSDSDLRFLRAVTLAFLRVIDLVLSIARLSCSSAEIPSLHLNCPLPTGHSSPRPLPPSPLPPHQRGQVVRRPSPLAPACSTESELTKIERGPISPSETSLTLHRRDSDGQFTRFLEAHSSPAVTRPLAVVFLASREVVTRSARIAFGPAFSRNACPLSFPRQLH